MQILIDVSVVIFSTYVHPNSRSKSQLPFPSPSAQYTCSNIREILQAILKIEDKDDPSENIIMDAVSTLCCNSLLRKKHELSTEVNKEKLSLK